MKKWLRRIRAALLMGLTWAAVWAPVGILIGMIDPEMKVYCPSVKPHASALGEWRGLGDLTKAKEPRIERARGVFAADWHRQLHVIKAENSHVDVDCVVWTNSGCRLTALLGSAELQLLGQVIVQ